MFQAPQRLQREFDQLAQFSSDRWDHNHHYHPHLLRALPARLDTALEIGCGTGAFARLLAARSNRVSGLDLSPEMIRIARERSSAQPNIEYYHANILEWDLPPASFDCIASIATLHHMALEPLLLKIKAALKPGGTLIVLDLYQAHTVGEKLYTALGLPVSQFYRMFHRGDAAQSVMEQQAWQQHGDGDVYPRLADVRALADAHLPGARVQSLLLWRYSLIWRKP